MTAGNPLAALDRHLGTHHLQVLGHCATLPNDGLNGKSIVLVGPDEPGFWGHLTQSPELHDGQPNPMDRWSARVLTDVAGLIGCTPLFPFGGPPHHPFFTWALRSGRFWASPIGFLVHDRIGLFASFRGAFLLSDQLPEPTVGPKPCDDCAAPCKSACPVGAFDGGYDVAACKAHISSAAGADCLTDGCRARRACPVGQGKRVPAQAQFHMEAFR